MTAVELRILTIASPAGQLHSLLPAPEPPTRRPARVHTRRRGLRSARASTPLVYGHRPACRSDCLAWSRLSETPAPREPAFQFLPDPILTAGRTVDRDTVDE